MVYRKILIRSILTAVFMLLTISIILRWLADTRFRSGQKLESAHRWPEARAEYGRAIALDPYNAEYFSGLGNFLYFRALAQKDNSPLLSEAESFYKRAVELEPRNAHHYLMLGLVELRLRKTDPGFARMVMADFQEAAANDPNGFNVSYAIGYSALSLWGSLDPQEKLFVLSKLRFAIRQHPEFADYIYPRLWGITRDPAVLSRLRPEDSGKERKARSEKIALIKQKNQSAARTRAFENIAMYWEETIDQPILVGGGGSTLSILAAGTSAHGIYPYMIVELDGVEIGEGFVDSEEWKEYSFKVDSPAGIKVLSLTFINDYQDGKSDRNLFIKEAAILKNER